MLLPVLLTILVLPSSAIPPSALNIEYAGHTLNALQRLFNFFQRDSRNINVDGLFCLRIAQSQLLALEQTMNSLNTETGKRLTDQHHILESFSQQLDRIINESWNELARRNTPYFQNFRFLLSRPFTFESHRKTLDLKLVETSTGKDSYFDLEQSDACFSELIGESPSQPATCSISETCQKKMTSTLTTGYRLTHQLLWILIAKNLNCPNIRLLTNFEDYFCANIYADATSNLINQTNQDLFIEQLLLCAIDGFDEFLRIDWLSAIFKWQHPLYDCFSGDSEISRVRRHLLFEEMMSDGCLSHKSGLGAGLFATYARFFLSNLE